MTTEEINKGLKIKKIKNVKFGNKIAYLLETGYALYHEKLGYLSFKEDNSNRKYGVKTPYMPLGGKKALQSLLKEGGFVNFDGIEWIWPIREKSKGTATLPR